MRENPISTVMPRRRARWLSHLAATLLALGASAAQAAPTTFTSEADAGGLCLPQINASALPTSATRDCNLPGFGSTTSAARAEPGSVGAAARATWGGSSNFVSAGATGRAADLPIVFTWIGTGTAPASNFKTSLNLELDGFMGTTGGSIEVYFEVLNGFGQGLGAYRHFELTNGNLQTSNSFAVTTGVNAAGSVARREFDLDLKTFDFDVSLNAPLELTLRLSTGVIAQQNAPNVAFSDFLNTGSFAKDRPVFNLPEGYTANAGTWLVNNRFGTPGTPPGTVPEPNGLALAGLALAALLGLRQGRSRRR